MADDVFDENKEILYNNPALEAWLACKILFFGVRALRFIITDPLDDKKYKMDGTDCQDGEQDKH